MNTATHQRITENRITAGIAACAKLLLLAACLVSSACTLVPPSRDDFAVATPVEVPDVRVANGAIYQVNRDRALFENPVAARVGDVLTVQLVESTIASKKSSTNTKKSTNASLGVGTSVFGRPVTVNGNSILNAGIDNSSDFTGEGNSAQSNSLAGDIAVTVAKRYANGNLLIRGQKWITINQGREFVRLEGIVRALDVQPDNTVPSTKVANAAISYGGQGALADANAKGWLARFFDSPLTPF